MTEQTVHYNNIQSEAVAIKEIKKYTFEYETYLKMNAEWKQKILDFHSNP